MKKEDITLSIRWKLLLSMTGLVVVLLSVLTLLQISAQKEGLEQAFKARIFLMKKQLVSQGKILSGNLASQVQNGIASFNLSRVSDLLQRTVKNNQDLHYAILMDNKRTAYVDTLNSRLVQTTLRDEAAEFAAKQKTAVTREYTRGNQVFMEFIVPVQVSMEPWGVLRLVFSLNRLHDEIAKSQQAISLQTHDMIMRTLMISIIFFVVGSGIIFWLAQRLSKPILMLADCAGELARGNFAAGSHVKMTDRDEIGVLASAFSEMSRNLQHSHNQLKDYSRTLEQKVDARTEELAIARDQAIAASKSKSEFLSMMSHEIRTPMNAIMGMTHLALKTDLTAKQTDYISKADAAARSLLGIINDILDFSKIEAGKMTIETVAFDLEQVLDNLSTMTDIKAQEKGLEIYFHLDADVPRALMGDPLRLGQILLNLAGNAIKFTEHGEITVRIQPVTTSQHLDANQIMLEMSVEDTGIGLSQQQMDKLFQSFSQADSSTTRKYGGTGLGLAISKQLVQLMGGTIRVESEQGKGSRFIFTAIFGLQAQAREDAFSTPETLTGMRVLVVDDSATSRQIMKYYMEGFSFHVDTAASGEDALDMLEHADFPYQLVLMDWKMPGMNGIETTRRIRALPNLSHIPTIIMVTAYGREEVMRQAQDAALDGFLIKPVGQSILFETLMSTFGQTVSRKHVRHHADTQMEEMSTIKGARILVVEDNAINQQVVREILEQAGLVVTLANNGKEGVQKVQSEPFDAVLMDLQMPVMDGYEATKLIREDERFKELPIIAMTAHAMVEEKEKCLAAGMNGHTPKPIDLEQLFGLLRQWITGDREQRAEDGCQRTEDGRRRTEEGELPEELAGFNLEACLKNLGGNEALLRTLLLDFYQEFSGAAEQIRTLLDQGDLPTAERLAHTIKGTSGNLSATALYDAAMQLDDALRQPESKNTWPALLDAFAAKLDAVMGSIACLNQEHPSGSDDVNVDMESIAPLLSELAGLLKENSMDADQCFQRLKEKLHHSSVNEPMQQLETAINSFDFDGAQLILAKVKEILTQ